MWWWWLWLTASRSRVTGPSIARQRPRP
jgi:hypothetical protein